MKDDLKDDLEGAMDSLKEEAEVFCKEKGLDPEKAVFTLQGYRNLSIKTESAAFKGIAALIEKAKNMINRIGFEEHEAMIFIIDEEYAISDFTIDIEEMQTAPPIEAHAHVRISILNRYRVKFFF